MNISARITDERVLDVRFDEASLIVDLMDGRTISAPLAWYPRLLRATAAAGMLTLTSGFQVAKLLPTPAVSEYAVRDVPRSWQVSS